MNQTHQLKDIESLTLIKKNKTNENNNDNNKKKADFILFTRDSL